MNVKFLNPFIDAACEVLKAECQCTVERGNLSMQKSSLTADEITVLISLVGQVQNSRNSIPWRKAVWPNWGTSSPGRRP